MYHYYESDYSLSDRDRPGTGVTEENLEQFTKRFVIGAPTFTLTIWLIAIII